MTAGYRTNARPRRGPSLTEAPRTRWWRWSRFWALWWWGRPGGGMDRRDAGREERQLLAQVRALGEYCKWVGMRPIDLVRSGWTVAALERVAAAAGVTPVAVVECLAELPQDDRRPHSAAVGLLVAGLRWRRREAEREQELPGTGGPVRRSK